MTRTLRLFIVTALLATPACVMPRSGQSRVQVNGIDCGPVVAGDSILWDGEGRLFVNGEQRNADGSPLTGRHSE